MIDEFPLRLGDATSEIRGAAIGRSGIRSNRVSAAGDAIMHMITLDARAEHSSRDDNPDLAWKPVSLGHDFDHPLQAQHPATSGLLPRREPSDRLMRNILQ